MKDLPAAGAALGQALPPGVVGAAQHCGVGKNKLRHEDDERKAGQGFCGFHEAQKEYDG